MDSEKTNTREKRKTNGRGFIVEVEWNPALYLGHSAAPGGVKRVEFPYDSGVLWGRLERPCKIASLSDIIEYKLFPRIIRYFNNSFLRNENRNKQERLYNLGRMNFPYEREKNDPHLSSL
ncbi:MAG: hypothetical protein WC511_02575 [Candidatus Pacearchaeota archaeon]